MVIFLLCLDWRALGMAYFWMNIFAKPFNHSIVVPGLRKLQTFGRFASAENGIWMNWANMKGIVSAQWH